MERKRRPAGAEAEYDAALATLRVAGAARFDFEMAATRLADIATLEPTQFFAALKPGA